MSTPQAEPHVRLAKIINEAAALFTECMSSPDADERKRAVEAAEPAPRQISTILWHAALGTDRNIPAAAIDILKAATTALLLFDEQRTLSVAQAAEHLGRSIPLVQRLARQSRIGVKGPDGKYYFSTEEIDRFKAVKRPSGGSRRRKFYVPDYHYPS